IGASDRGTAISRTSLFRESVTCELEERHGSNLPGNRGRSRFRTQCVPLEAPHEASLQPEYSEEAVLRSVSAPQRHPDCVRQGHQGHRRAWNRRRGQRTDRYDREALMAKAQDIRHIIKLKSTAGTGYTYVTRKNRRNSPDRIVLKKYDPVIRKHVDFREER